MTAENDETSEPFPDNDAVTALRGAMEASASKDRTITRAVEVITESLRRLKWATRRNLVVLVALIIVIGYGAREYANFSARSDTNQKLLSCLAHNDEIVTQDLNLFADTHGNAPHYPNAKSCTHLAK